VILHTLVANVGRTNEMFPGGTRSSNTTWTICMRSKGDERPL